MPIDPLNINGSPLEIVCKGECFGLAIKKHPPLFAPQSEARNSIYHKKGVAQFNVIKGCIRVITEMALLHALKVRVILCILAKTAIFLCLNSSLSCVPYQPKPRGYV